MSEHFIQDCRLGEFSHAEPQVVVHRVMERFVERADALAEFSAPEDSGLGDEVFSKEFAIGVSVELAVFVTDD